MQPSGTTGQMSGMKLIFLAIILALVPVLGEVVSDGGPSHFGDPETGYFMMFMGLFMWPTALVLFLVGLKRAIFDNRSTDSGAQPPVRPEAPAKPVAMTDAWAEQNSNPADATSQQKKENQ